MSTTTSSCLLPPGRKIKRSNRSARREEGHHEGRKSSSSEAVHCAPGQRSIVKIHHVPAPLETPRRWLRSGSTAIRHATGLGRPSRIGAIEGGAGGAGEVPCILGWVSTGGRVRPRSTFALLRDSGLPLGLTSRVVRARLASPAHIEARGDPAGCSRGGPGGGGGAARHGRAVAVRAGEGWRMGRAFFETTKRMKLERELPVVGPIRSRLGSGRGPALIHPKRATNIHLRRSRSLCSRSAQHREDSPRSSAA